MSRSTDPPPIWTLALLWLIGISLLASQIIMCGKIVRGPR